ncbi:MAG: ribonuclease, partial [Gaiellaceae bacterium]|nr:ribonuclease [Gaiellaceae bacterium]
TQAPTWEKERLPGIRILLRAIADGKPDAPDQILERWTWKLARATRKVQDRRASSEYPEAKRLLGALANSRGHRHEENAAKLVKTALEQPIQVGAALLASAEGYTPRATKLIEEAREKLGPVQEVALALSDNLPAPKTQPNKRRRRRRKKKDGTTGEAATTQAAGEQAKNGDAPTKPKRRRRRKPPGDGAAKVTAEPAAAPAAATAPPEPS